MTGGLDGMGIVAHLVVVGIWVVASAALVGLGQLLRRAWGLPTTTWRDVSASFWVGIAVSVGLLQVWHLFRPVDGTAAIGLALLGLAGCVVARTDVARIARAADARLVAVGVLALLWLANRALGPVTLSDTGMYHQPTVAWTNAFAIIPGLGNLHGRLAFNSSALLFAAPFDTGWLDGAAVHLVTSLLLAALVMEALCAWSTARRERVPRAWDLFSLAILPNVLHGALRPEVRSLSTDAAVAAILFAALRALVDVLAHSDADRRNDVRRAAVVVLLFTLAVTVKLSAAVVAFAAVLVVAWHVVRRASEDLGIGRLAAYALPPLVLFAVWVVRGVILSGYPLYPSTVLPLAVDWRVPLEQALAEAAWVEMSARNLNSNVIHPGTSWIVPWIRGIIVRGDPFVQVAVPAGLAFLGLVLSRRKAAAVPDESNGAFDRSWRLAWVPIGAGLLFWLSTAPHPRMAQAIAWSGAALVLSRWAMRSAGTKFPAARLGFVALVVAAGLALKQGAGAAWRATPGERIDAAARALVTLPDSGRWVASLNQPELRPMPIAVDLTVMMPADDNLCWNTSELCTPHPSSALRLRQPGSGPAAWGSGFRSVDGRWDPTRWPNPWTPFLAWWRCVREGTATEQACLQRTRAPGSPPDTPGSR